MQLPSVTPFTALTDLTMVMHFQLGGSNTPVEYDAPHTFQNICLDDTADDELTVRRAPPW